MSADVHRLDNLAYTVEAEAGYFLSGDGDRRWWGSRIKWRRPGERRWRSTLVRDLHPMDVAAVEMAVREIAAREL